MRFCMVTTFYPPYHFGGDATYVRALSRALISRGHSVEVIHCEDAYRLSGKGIDPRSANPDDGVLVHRLKSRLGPLSPLITQQTGRPGLKAVALKAILKRGFDVVNFHNISLVGGPAILELSTAPVTLYTLHEHWLLCPTHIFWKNRSKACDTKQCVRCSLWSGVPLQWWRYTGLIKRAVGHVDLFLAPSEFTAERHRKAGIGPVQVLPLFSSLAAEAVGDQTASTVPRFIFVGRVTASKGIHLLLEQFSRLPQYELIVVGDGDLRAKVERQYAGHDNIRFLGQLPQDKLAAVYRTATALVLPSLAPETFGLTVTEAFAHGTPAIVRDAGGSRELVDASGGGIVYRTDAELLKAIHALARDDALRAQLGQHARAGFEKFYTEQKHVDAYLACIHKVRQRVNTPAQ